MRSNQFSCLGLWQKRDAPIVDKDTSSCSGQSLHVHTANANHCACLTTKVCHVHRLSTAGLDMRRCRGKVQWQVSIRSIVGRDPRLMITCQTFECDSRKPAARLHLHPGSLQDCCLWPSTICQVDCPAGAGIGAYQSRYWIGAGARLSGTRACLNLQYARILLAIGWP